MIAAQSQTRAHLFPWEEGWNLKGQEPRKHHPALAEEVRALDKILKIPGFYKEDQRSTMCARVSPAAINFPRPAALISSGFAKAYPATILPG